MYCPNCGAQQSDSTMFCSECGTSLKDNTSGKNPKGSATVGTDQNRIPEGKTGKKKSKLPKILITLAGIIVGLVIIITAINYFTQPRLKLGKNTDEVSAKITTNGGRVSVGDPTSAINGFTINIDPGTYKTDTDFDISTTEITGHTYGNEFSPITPLITVDNGGGFSEHPMQVTIPIDITEEEFAMGFYYDAKTKELEAIPYVSISADKITLLTNHFSNIVVSKISIAELERLTSNTKTNADSGFKPGFDDWQFINYGSALAPGGHCAGQSLTMSWYYQKVHREKSEARLYGRFDNNGDTKTESFWQDDSEAYRFASAVQYNIDWDSLEFNKYLDFSRQNQKRVFYAFSYSILVTGTPQFMGIYHYDNYGNIAGGHAIVAYKVEGNRIYVADPNFPGQEDRYCELGSDGFKPYSSGANAADISASGGTLYTEMIFIAGSALIDYSVIEQGYSDMLGGKAGDGIFPGSDIEIMTLYNDDLNNIGWSSSKDLTLGKGFYDSLPSDMKDSTLIRITPRDNNLVYSLYLNGSTTAEQDPVFEVFENRIYFQIGLANGVNELAILTEKEISGNYSYVDFVDLKINYSAQGSVAATTAAATPTKATAVQTPAATSQAAIRTAAAATTAAATAIPTAAPTPAATTQKTSGNALADQLPGEYELTMIGGVGAPGSPNTDIMSETYFIYASGKYSKRATFRTTDPILMEGEWTLTGNVLKFDDGLDYIFNGGNTFYMDTHPQYTWTYTAVRKYD